MTAPGSPCERVRQDGCTGIFVYRKCRDGSRTEGFTILEILIAMTLTGFGILGFAGLLEVIGNAGAEDAWVTKALFCAQERMEEIKFRAATDGLSTTQGQEDVADGPYQGMRRTWAVGDSPILDGLLEVRVECAYPWKDGTKTVRLSTLVFPEGH